MINLFTPKGFPIDELNRLALDKVKAYTFIPNVFLYGIHYHNDNNLLKDKKMRNQTKLKSF